MIINGLALLFQAPIKNMLQEKVAHNGVTHGLTECGYDIRVKQDVYLSSSHKFALASSMEEFQMPNHLMAVVHDKSSWARRGLSVFNSCIEPGWNGFLTIELVYHGNEDLLIPAGSGIAQVIFHDILEPASYRGRYNNQPDRPVSAINS
jgi:dCTP deaminase